MTNPLTAANQTKTTARTQYPSSQARQALLQKGFVEKHQGVYQKKQIGFADAKQLLHFDTSDMKPIPSCPDNEQSFWIALEEGVCVVTIPSGTSATNASVLVDIVINTNPIPIGHKLTPRQKPANNENSPVSVERK